MTAQPLSDYEVRVARRGNSARARKLIDADDFMDRLWATIEQSRRASHCAQAIIERTKHNVSEREIGRRLAAEELLAAISGVKGSER
jgi:hypothetical protein